MSLPNLSTIPKLTGRENFLLWRSLVTLQAEPDSFDPISEMRARHIILTTVDVTIAQNLVRLGTAKQMWDALHDIYARAADQIDHPDEFLTLDKMEPESFMTFNSFMWTFVGEVEKLRDAGCELSEKDAMFRFLRKLAEGMAVILHLLGPILEDISPHTSLLELIGYLYANHDQDFRHTYNWL